MALAPDSYQVTSGRALRTAIVCKTAHARCVPDRAATHGQRRSLADKSQRGSPALMQVTACVVAAFQAGHEGPIPFARSPEIPAQHPYPASGCGHWRPAPVPRFSGPAKQSRCQRRHAASPTRIGERRSHYGLVMPSRWLGWLAAAAVALAACVLVILDVTDAGLRRWWDDHALTTDTVAGLLVLMITVLVVDQVVRLRQGNARARAVAVQVAILTTQANIASRAVSQVLAGSGDRDAAYEEFRTFTMMVLSVAPVLIDARTSRSFLERAQDLDAAMAQALSVLATVPGQEKSVAAQLNDSLQRLKSASTPLIQNLPGEMRSAVRGDHLT
jgi:hypothetical protein